MRTAACAILVFCFCVGAFAQETDLSHAEGVQQHKGIDTAYRDFSESYRTLDAKLVAGLYTETANYLPPSETVITGRKAILDSFVEFFGGVRSRGQSMTIKFHIEKRHVSKNLGYDIGTFKIVYSKDGGELDSSLGRFIVITQKGMDKKWRFAVDSYHRLSKATK